VREQLEGETHNTSQIPPKAMVNTLEFLSEEMEESLGVKLAFPVDEPNREYVFFCAVSDFLLEPDTLMGNAAVLYAAGDWDKWTIGTGNFDGINYGLFYSDWHLENIIKQLLAEVVFNFMEYTLDCLRRGRIQLDPTIVTERVTYHDPCNIARSGWIVDQPREILRAFVDDFVEMEPYGERNYCCGGGGGLVSVDELHDFRMDIGGKVKAEQIRRTGAKIVISPCANCKKQLKELVEHYELPCQVMGLHDLILKAIVIPGCKSPQQRREEADLYAI